MARGIQNFPNISTSDPNFPDGRIRNNNGSSNGTPVNEFVYGDIHQFFAKVLREMLITPNGLAESDYPGYQYFDALNRLAKKYINIVFVNGDVASDTSHRESLVVFNGSGTSHIFTINNNIGQLTDGEWFEIKNDSSSTTLTVIVSTGNSFSNNSTTTINPGETLRFVHFFNVSIPIRTWYSV